MNVAWLLGQPYFKENSKWRRRLMTDSSVAGEEGKSDSLKVAAEARARLITPAKVTILFVYTILESTYTHQ